MIDVTEWIDIKDGEGPPREDYRVLCWDDDPRGGVVIARYHGPDKDWTDDEGDGIGRNITHWMALPDPPPEEDGD